MHEKVQYHYHTYPNDVWHKSLKLAGAPDLNLSILIYGNIYATNSPSEELCVSIIIETVYTKEIKFLRAKKSRQIAQNAKKTT